MTIFDSICYPIPAKNNQRHVEAIPAHIFKQWQIKQGWDAVELFARSHVVWEIIDIRAHKIAQETPLPLWLAYQTAETEILQDLRNFIAAYET